MENNSVKATEKVLIEKIKTTKDEKLRQELAEKLKTLGKVICK